MTWPLDCARPNERLANHTSFRIGGPAEWFAQPRELDELLGLLRAASHSGLPVFIIGGGTNLLVPDRGIRGLVLQLSQAFRTVEILSRDGEPWVRVCCGAGVFTQRLVSLACRYGWTDCESLAGLPGQVGGAVVMNAQRIGRFVERVTLVTFSGEVRVLTKEQLHFAYRYTALEPGILVEVVFRFRQGTPACSVQRIQDALHRRNATQDIQLPSAGCAFKNLPSHAAGQLIEEAGLKGTQVGDAKVSLRHANFIVNVGHATCDDVLSLMESVQRAVSKRIGVWLEPEVRVLGERWP